MERDQKNVVNVIIEGFSAALITNYILQGTNYILYLKGIIDSSHFEQTVYNEVKCFMLKTMLDKDNSQQQRRMIEKSATDETLESVVLIIQNEKTREKCEEWHFHINYDDNKKILDTASSPKRIAHESRAFLRRILEADNELPLLGEGKWTFDIQTVLKFRINANRTITTVKSLKLL